MPAPNPLTFLLNSLRTQIFHPPSPPTQPFTGQTIIVTGSNTGLGLAAIQHFVALDAARIILTSRDLRKGEAALARVEKATRKSDIVEVWQLDLSSTKSVKAFAERVERELDRVDVLVENAGSATEVFRRVGDEVMEGSGEGTETILAVNVIGTFLLAMLLVRKLGKTRDFTGVPAKLCVVTSDLHFLTELPQREAENVLEVLNEEKSVPSMFDRYNISKLIEVLLVRHMATLIPSSSLIINSCNPGLVDTELSRDQGAFGKVFKFIFRAWTPEVGSRSLVHAVSLGEEAHGKHVRHGVLAEPSDFAKSEEGAQTARKIWNELLARFDLTEGEVLGRA